MCKRLLLGEKLAFARYEQMTDVGKAFHHTRHGVNLGMLATGKH